MSTEGGKTRSLTKGVRRSVSRTFKGIGRTLSRSKPRSLSLPKVSRARNVNTKTKKKDNKKKTIKERKKAPELSTTLNTILTEKKDIVLFLGEDFAKAVNCDSKLTKFNVDLYIEALSDSSLLTFIAEEEIATEVKSVLDNASSEKDPTKKVQAALVAEEKLKGAIGEELFSRKFSKVLSQFEAEEDKVDELAAKLIKAINPKLIVYSGRDSSLESIFKHDNFPVKPVTVQDLQAEEFSVTSLSASKDKLLLKLNGDIAQPDSVSYILEDIFSNFGFQADGEPLKEDEVSLTGKYLTGLLADLSEAFSLVFLGAALDKKDPLSFFFKNAKSEEIKHVALVTQVEPEDEVNKRFDSKETGIDYITYEPDESHSQIFEFLASMATVASTPFVSETDAKIFTKAFVQSKALGEFLSEVADKEGAAKTVCYFANDLLSLEFVQEESFKEEILLADVFAKGVPKGLKEEEEKKLKEDLAEALTKKEKVLSEKVLSEDADVLVKVLLSAKSLTSDISEAKKEKKESVLSKYKSLLTFAENASIDLRIVETDEEIADDFSLLYLGEKGFGDVALVKEAKREFFNVSLYQENTNEAEETVLLFERLWNVALKKSASLKFVIDTLEAEAEEATEKKEKKRLFSKQFFGGKKEKNGQDKKSKKKAEEKKEVKAEEKKEEEKVEEKKEEKPAEKKEDVKEEVVAEKKEEKPEEKKTDKKAAKKKAAPKKAEKKKVEKKTPAKKAAKKDAKAEKKVEEKKEEVKAEEKKEEVKVEEVKKEEVKDEKKVEEKKTDKKAAKKKAAPKKAEKKKVEKKAPAKKAAKKTAKKDEKAEVKKEEPKAEEKKEEKTEKVEEKKEVEEVKKEEVKDDKKVEEKKTDKKAAKKKAAPKKAEKKKVEKKAPAKKAVKKAEKAVKKDTKKAKKEEKKEEAKEEKKEVKEVEKKEEEIKVEEKKEEEVKVEEKKEEVEEKKEEVKEEKTVGRMSKFAARMRSTMPRPRKNKKAKEETKEEVKVEEKKEEEKKEEVKA